MNIFSFRKSFVRTIPFVKYESMPSGKGFYISTLSSSYFRNDFILSWNSSYSRNFIFIFTETPKHPSIVLNKFCFAKIILQILFFKALPLQIRTISHQKSLLSSQSSCFILVKVYSHENILPFTKIVLSKIEKSKLTRVILFQKNIPLHFFVFTLRG